jgi:hypothetical protein
MISFGLPESAQNGIKTAVDDLRLKIETLEAESQANQSVYEDLVQEMKAKLEQRIREVKEQVKIKPFADLQAASLATDHKVQALAEKLNSADAANEQLSQKVEALEAQNLQL